MECLLKNKGSVSFFLCLIAGSIIFSSCGDIFDYREKIARNYYLTEIDSRNHLSIGYKISEMSFITRVPPRVSAYSIVGDSLLVAKTKDDINNVETVYIINMRKDFDVAKPDDYLVAPPMSVAKYRLEWESVLRAKFISVPMNYK
jgi:hypothetical protein